MKLRRTLLTAGVFALLAMVFVRMPTRHGGGYRLILDTSDTSIAFLQLLVNVVFAALAGTIVANLSKRALYVIGGCIAACIAVYAAGLGVFTLKQAIEYAPGRARSDKQCADEILQLQKEQHGNFDRVHYGANSSS